MMVFRNNKRNKILMISMMTHYLTMTIFSIVENINHQLIQIKNKGIDQTQHKIKSQYNSMVIEIEVLKQLITMQKI